MTLNASQTDCRRYDNVRGVEKFGTRGIALGDELSLN